MKEQMDNKNAGFAPRFFATIIENFITFIIWMILLYFPIAAFSMQNIVTPTLNFTLIFLLFIFIGGVIQIFYHVYFVTNYGGAIGKLLFGLKIVDANTNELIDKKRALYRYIAGYPFSGVFFGLGFFRIIKHENNLAWHDELFNTKVVGSNKDAMGYLSLFMLLIVFIALVYLIASTFSQNVLPFIIEISTAIPAN